MEPMAGRVVMGPTRTSPVKMRNPPSSSGFTLIEVVVVLAVAAILAGAAALSLRGPYQAARLEDAIERLVLVDRQLRDHAQRFERPAQLNVCPNSGQIAAVEPKGDRPPIQAFQLDGAIKIEEVATPQRRSDCDVVAIPYSTQGRSPTFAVRLRGADNRQHWLLFVGTTGQMIRFEDDRTVEELLHLVSTQGTNAG
jgi:prepilin-type N-terminal cleavage/methylation domain-containing protein